jgi:hypothetical protein
MRIISPFRDYYDGVQGLGFDDKIVYTRESVQTELPGFGTYRFTKNKSKKKEISDVLPPFHNAHPELGYLPAPQGAWKLRRESFHCPWKGNETMSPTTGMLYFCGKAYPFYLAHRLREDSLFSHQPGFEKLVDQAARKSRWDRSRSNPTPYRQWIEEHTGKEIDPELHFQHKSPIILFIGKTRIVNPCLKDFAFQRLIDSYTAFQELDMFMGGVMGEAKDPPAPMTDVEKIKSHGMDTKWSFRKPPGG